MSESNVVAEAKRFASNRADCPEPSRSGVSSERLLGASESAPLLETMTLSSPQVLISYVAMACRGRCNRAGCSTRGIPGPGVADEA